MSYSIEFLAVAEADLKKLGRQNQRRVLIKIMELLADKPKKMGKPLKHKLKGCFRLRVLNKFRVIYRVVDDKKKGEGTVFIMNIANRDKIYS